MLKSIVRRIWRKQLADWPDARQNLLYGERIPQTQVAREAKAIVALAFRNGPIENIHAGRPCPTCSGQAGYSRISDAEMK